MGFAWVTTVGVGDAIDAADRVETKDNIASLYTDLGKNWPGNVRFPACGGAGYDMGAPCAVVWDIAPDDAIYQTPGAHPVSELQEARDKLDWIKDNDCGAENVAHDNPENAAANPTTRASAYPITRSAANPVTRSAANPVTRSAANPTTQDAENPVTQAAANPTTQDAENPVTQAAANPATQFEDQMGNTAACPNEYVVDDTDYTGENYNENISEDISANDTYDADLATYKAIYEGVHYSGNEANDRGTVQGTNFYTNWPIVDIFVHRVYNAPYCSAENSGVFTHVDYSDVWS